MCANQVQLVRKDLGEVFGGPRKGVEIWVNGTPEPHPYVPELDTGFLPPAWTRDILLWLSADKPEPLYITGPSGCGKTAAIKYIAAKTGMPVYEVNGSALLEVPALKGCNGVRGGQTVWIDGPLTLAMREGAWFLLNEVDLNDPGVQAELNTILDGSPLCLEGNGGELVRPAPGFCFIVTGNTNGRADSTGMFAGTRGQNFAFVNRFSFVRGEYMETSREELVLAKKYPGIPEIWRKSFCKIAALTRKAASGERMEQGYEDCVVTEPLTMRDLLQTCEWVMRYTKLGASYDRGNLLHDVFDRVTGYEPGSPDYHALRSLVQHVMGDTLGNI